MMLDETSETGTEATAATYEPPALVVLGSVAELTAVVDGSLHDESDRLLKAGVRPVERPLERLRAIRTR